MGTGKYEICVDGKIKRIDNLDGTVRFLTLWEMIKWFFMWELP